MQTKLLLATNNTGKVKEFRDLLQGIPLELVALADEGIETDVKETGNSFEENARLKASLLAEESNLLSLADDSGLEVDALGGEPGIKSARYAGKDATDSDRINYLLSKMKGVPWAERTASFKCVIAVAVPGGDVEFCYGECRGIITLEPRGNLGFGYDPLFYFPELGKTMSELSLEVKNRVSHRALAARQVPDVLKRPSISAFLSVNQ